MCVLECLWRREKCCSVSDIMCVIMTGSVLLSGVDLGPGGIRGAKGVSISWEPGGGRL